MAKIHKFHSDAGHGWLAVKRAELAKLGLLANISSCSYQNGATVYLEEDRDARLFERAYHLEYGETLRLQFLPQRQPSPVRRYASFCLAEEEKH